MGTGDRKPTEEYTAEDIAFLMGTNFESAYGICQLAHPLLRASGAGSIVFVSSVAGVLAVNVGSLYCSAKGHTYFFTHTICYTLLMLSRMDFAKLGCAFEGCQLISFS